MDKTLDSLAAVLGHVGDRSGERARLVVPGRARDEAVPAIGVAKVLRARGIDVEHDGDFSGIERHELNSNSLATSCYLGVAVAWMSG